MARADPAFAIILSLALSGCAAGGEGGTSDSSTSAPGTTTTSAPPTAPLNDTVVKFYLTADLKLTREVPAQGQVAVPAGTAFATLAFAAEPLARPAMLPDREATLEFWFQTDVPVPTNGALDVAAWAGTTRGMPAFGTTVYPGGVLLPGSAVPLKITLGLADTLPPVATAGDAVALTVGAFGDNAGTTRLLVGGSTPSALTLRLRETATDPLANLAGATSTTETGSLVPVGAVTACSPSADPTEDTFQVALGANATFLELELSATGSDLDLHVRSGTTEVGRALTPGGSERVLLGGEAFSALRGTSVDVQVLTCTGGPVDYSLTLRHD